MEEKLRQLKMLLNEASDLEHVVELMEWDAETYMPPGGAEDRAHHRATVESLMHRKYAAEEMGRLLEELKPWAAQLDPDSDDARLVRVTEREYLRRVKVPAEMVAELAQIRTIATAVWQEARQDNDFPRFRPHLEKIVDWRRRYASLFAPYEHIYDPLLAEFEPGMKTAEVQAVFNTLRPRQVALVREITVRPQVEADFLYQPYDEQKQWDFGVEVITGFGYDWKRGRQDRTAHPFTIHFGIDDVRITTRFMPDYFSSAFFSTTHECGHALYEQGVDRALARTTLARGSTMALHESQSRLWENLVGRSRPFWEGFYPRLQEVFPMQLGGVSLEKFYKGINRVEPSLIRVEADEATYNLHVMLRLELEIALIEGSLEVKDLPEAWNTRMQEYLGLTPPNDALGVLQDIHWSSGYFGYFATYTMGNVIASQLWQRIEADIPDLTGQIRRGEFATLLGWLREKVHRHGRKFEAQELVQRITGSRIDPAPYLSYLQTKYSEIYGF
jgi:carboxypeptidase Taq